MPEFLAGDGDADLRGDGVGLDRLGEADHAGGIDGAALEDRRVGVAAEVALARGDVAEAAAEDHLHGRDEEVFLDQPRLGVGAEGGIGQRQRLEEGLVRARGAVADEDVGGVGRKEVAPVGRPVLVGGVDVEGVGLGVLPEAERAGAVALRHREAGKAAPEHPAGDRGRGVAEGRAVEEHFVLEAVVELGRPRLGRIDDVGELREGLRFQRRVAAVAVVVEVAGVAGGAAAFPELAEDVESGGLGPGGEDRAGLARRQGEGGLEALGGGVPGGVGGGDGRYGAGGIAGGRGGDDSGRRRRRGRRSRGRRRDGGEARREDGIGGEGREDRVGGDGGGVGEGADAPGGGGGGEVVERGRRRALDHRHPGAGGVEAGYPRVGGEVAVEEGSGAGDVPGVGRREGAADVGGDGGHGEEVGGRGIWSRVLGRWRTLWGFRGARGGLRRPSGRCGFRGGRADGRGGGGEKEGEEQESGPSPGAPPVFPVRRRSHGLGP